MSNSGSWEPLVFTITLYSSAMIYIKWFLFLFLAVDMKSGTGEIYRGDPKNKKADCTMIMDDADMVAMATGKLNGQQVYMLPLTKWSLIKCIIYFHV